MTYTPNIPQTGESLGGTRPRINTNFQEIFNVINQNHVPFNSVGEGKHAFLQMPEQPSAPATAVDEGGLYTKVGAGPAESNLFFRGENNGQEYQLTRVDQTLFADFATNVAYSGLNTKGWTFLPGGLILNYGFRAGGADAVTFAKPFTTFVVGVLSNTGTATSVGLNGFNLSANAGAWIAIGV